MRNYEVTFIVDPVLSGDEIKTTAETYINQITEGECKIVHVSELGLRQLAYPIKNRTTGVYYCVEFECETGAIISKLELSLRRDERIMRFLSVKLDKYGVKYNEDKRNGLIGTVKKKKKKEDTKDDRRGGGKPRPKAQEKEKTPAKAVEKTVEKVKTPAPVAAATVAVGTDTAPDAAVVKEEEE